jgi:L-alanine-DL-glutamate epimerase-like enolase superfamily enzyme
MPSTEFERITVHRLEVPLTVPYRLAFGPVEFYDTIIAELTARDGRSGLGEATVLTGYTEETIEDSWRVARELASEIARLGRGAVRSRLDALAKSHPFTATAFGTALEMLEASRFLEVRGRTPVPLVGMLNATGERARREEFERLLAAGYRTVKLKVGFDVGRDLEHVRAVQALARGKAAIRIDANQGYSSGQGVAFVRALDPAGIELFEQPCPAGDWDAHLTVARAAAVPMMLDESIYGLADIERAAERKAATYVKVKLMKLGTMHALAAAIERIRSLGMRPVLGNGVACDLGCWMEGCVAARHIDNAGEMNGFLKARGALLTEPLEFHDGAMWLKPGFAPRLDPERLEAFLVDSVTCPARTVVGAAGASGGSP